MKTIEIRGVWLMKSTAHNGNQIEVLVELADGTHHVAIAEVADDGPISHYVHPAGIVQAPVREFVETLRVAEPSATTASARATGEIRSA